METPTISGHAYSSSILTPFEVGGAVGAPGVRGERGPQGEAGAPGFINHYFIGNITMSQARIVKVFIADPHESLPLAERVLYTGDEKLTDLTDQELFFELPMAGLLEDHNTKRLKTLDKKQSERFGRDVFLEAARIRDLKMVVVTIAQF